MLFINNYVSDLYIISDNCWGYGVYKRLNLKYNSPFICTYIHTPDYIKLLLNLDDYLNCQLVPIEFNKTEHYNKYKVSRHSHTGQTYTCKLHDIEIIFYHRTDSLDECITKWYKRRDRLISNKDKIIVKFSNEFIISVDVRYDNFDSMLEQFHSLPYKTKLSFTSRKFNYPLNFKIYPIHLLHKDKLGEEHTFYFKTEMLYK